MMLQHDQDHDSYLMPVRSGQEQLDAVEQESFPSLLPLPLPTSHVAFPIVSVATHYR